MHWNAGRFLPLLHDPGRGRLCLPALWGLQPATPGSRLCQKCWLRASHCAWQMSLAIRLASKLHRVFRPTQNLTDSHTQNLYEFVKDLMTNNKKTRQMRWPRYFGSCCKNAAEYSGSWRPPAVPKFAAALCLTGDPGTDVGHRNLGPFIGGAA